MKLITNPRLVGKTREKMEVTNDTRIKVFGQYIGQKIMLDKHDIYTGFNMCGAILRHLENDSIGWPKLILKPLSSITDEDAIEVAKMVISPINYPRTDYKITRHNTSVEVKLDNSHFEDSVFIGNSGNVWTTVKHPRYGNEVFQFFTDKGYDQKQKLLNNQTLKEAELAIYK